MIKRLLVLAFFSALVSTAFAENVEINIRVYSRANPSVGVPSRILRKKPQLEVEELGATDEDGKLVVYDTDCSTTTSYRAVSMLPAVFPDGPPEWKPCVQGQSIEIAMVSTGLSSITKAFLENRTPSDWKVPNSYASSVDALLVAQKEGQWGVAAKLGSQLAYRFNEAGLEEQALVFGELSLASAGIFALETSASQTNIDVILVTSPTLVGAMLSPEAVEAIKSMQSECGVAPTGKVGWTTMSCLPGGDGYKLPAETLAKIESGSTGGGF